MLMVLAGCARFQRFETGLPASAAEKYFFHMEQEAKARSYSSFKAWDTLVILLFWIWSYGEVVAPDDRRKRLQKEHDRRHISVPIGLLSESMGLVLGEHVPGVPTGFSDHRQDLFGIEGADPVINVLDALAGLVGEECAFTLVASDPGDDTLQVAWEFSDGKSGQCDTTTHT